MQKLTRDGLIAELYKHQFVTGGWPVVIAYDRRAANEMLWQGYVNRAESESFYFRPSNFFIEEGDAGAKDHIYGLVLSEPILSFEQSGYSGASATLSTNVIGGLVIGTVKSPNNPVAVTKINRLLPSGDARLSMTQPLSKGKVGEDGNVSINMENAEHFKANFTIGTYSAATIEGVFKEYCAKILPKGMRDFSLGTLSNQAGGVLKPESFIIQTMSLSDQAASGDGLILMFVDTVAGTRDAPAAETFLPDYAPYLLPLDEPDKRYTIATYISRKVAFETLLGPYLESCGPSEPSKFTFKPYQDVGSPLRGATGGFVAWNTKAFKLFPDPVNADIEFGYWLDWSCGSADPEAVESNANVRTYTDGKGLFFQWAWTSNEDVDVRYNTDWGQDLGDTRWPGVRSYSWTVPYYLGLSNNGSFKFKRGIVDHKTSWQMDHGDVLISTEFVESQFLNNLNFQWEAYPINPVPSIDIDTGLVQNLLFPGGNTLSLKDVYIPGDLVSFGDIIPKHQITLSPATQTVARGAVIRFDEPEISSPTWAALEVSGKVLVGHCLSFVKRARPIKSSVYLDTSRLPAQLPGGFVTIKLTLSGTRLENDQNVPVSSSVLIHVVQSDISFGPLFGTNVSGRALDLKGRSLSGAELNWSFVDDRWGSTLVKTPEGMLYTAGRTDLDIPYLLDEIKLSTGDSVEYIRLLIMNDGAPKDFPIDISDKIDPASGSVELVLLDAQGRPFEDVTWTLLYGPGSLDAAGHYSQPSDVLLDDFVIVWASTPIREKDNAGVRSGNFNSWLVMPLPLSEFYNLIHEHAQGFYHAKNI